MSRIKVGYDGRYPNACSGTLTIECDSKVIYSECYVCHSTGGVWFDADWNEHVEGGELVWEKKEIEKIPVDIRKEVQEAVDNCLSRVRVCCGGCV